jgi:hypothetical protein
VFNWLEECQLKLSYEKCIALILNPKRLLKQLIPFKINNYSISFTQNFRDLGILFNSDFKFNAYIQIIVKKAHLTSNCIFRSFKTKNMSLLLTLYKTFVRPKVEYASQIWNPYKKKEIILLEKVQKRFTKRLPGLKEKEPERIRSGKFGRQRAGANSEREI